MLRASTLISGDLRPSGHLTARKPIRNPRLGTLRPHRRPSRSPCPVRLLCRATHSDGPISTAVENTAAVAEGLEGSRLTVGEGSSSIPVLVGRYRMSMGDQAFFLLALIAGTASLAFTGLVIAAVPTLYAMKRAATSLAKLADTAREELPSTMAAIRLSGMEISDLTLELSDLSHEITDGVNKSVQAVHAADAGIRQIGSFARRQTISMIQERASLPNISVKPVVAGAAKKTSRAVERAAKRIMNFISRGGSSSENEGQGSDEVDY